MNTIAYLLYGDTREYHLELTYSVLTARHFLRSDIGDTRLLLITQENQFRDDLPIEQIHFSSSQFDDWTYGRQYFHGAKVHALALALDNSDGPVVLIDTDTAFTSSPRLLFDRIGPGRSVLHERRRLQVIMFPTTLRCSTLA
jgi:hypothetical protein